MRKIFLAISLTIFLHGTFFTQDTTYFCNDWAQMQIGSQLIENNVWGKGDIVDYTQCIYKTSSNKFGWHWDWPYSGDNVKSYPEVIFGKKPWSNESTHPSLPTQLSAIKTFTVDFALDMIQALEEMPARNGKRMAFRLGINSGPLVAGVIGE